MRAPLIHIATIVTISFAHAPPDVRAAEYSFINVADTTMAAPSGTFSNFLSNFYDPPAISGSNVAFIANYDGGTQSGVFRGSGGPLTTIADSGNVAGGYGSFNDPAIHGEMVAFEEGDNVVYYAGSIFMGNGGPLTKIVGQGISLPGVNGGFISVNAPGFNGNAVGFFGLYDGYPYITSGIFQGTGGPLSTVVAGGGSAPAFSNGAVASQGNAGGGAGVVRRSGDTTTPIYRWGDSISGLRLDWIPTEVRLSISGDTVVFAGQNNGSGSDYIEAIVAGDGGTPTLIAKTGDPAPIDTFNFFSSAPSISGDTIVFAASYGGDLAHPSGNGIFTSTNGALATVIQSGEPLFGSTLTDVETGRFAIDPDGSGNLAFAYKLADGREGVALARAVLESITGDYNGNGTVDAADCVIWRNTLGDTGTGLAADGNRNDGIDAGDYDLWRAHFGESTEAQGIPEPASWLLLAFAGAAFVGIGAWRMTRLGRDFPILLCFFAVLALAGRADAGTLYAATAGAHGELYILDPNTGGVLRDVGPLNDASGRNYPMDGLAFQPDTGVLFGATHYSDTADPATVSKLVTINPDTAEVTVVGSFFLGNPGTMADITFTYRGNLIGIGTYGPPQIYNIDVRTGISTPVFVHGLGDFPATEGGGIADISITYVTPTASEFGVVQPCFFAHGFCYPPPFYESISHPEKPAGGGNYGALDFDGFVLYGLNVGPGSPPQTHLVRINAGTGAVTDIGRSVDGLAAIAFIPEPATLALLMAGFAGLVSCVCGRLNRTRWTQVPNRCVALLLFAAICVCLAPQPARAVTIDWINVGDPGNPPNRNGQGDVSYVYRIGKYDVTVSQYVEFLNQKDLSGANTLGLYDPNMSDATYGGISCNASAADGSKYEVIVGRGNHPVNYVTWFDAARFANWLHNGQGNGDTEDGAYTLLGGTPIPSNSMEVTRNHTAQVFIPSQDEWIKAGHFLPGANIYFEYPTSSNTPPVSSTPTNVINRANFLPNGPGNLTDVGAYTGTTSRYGAYDMAGNVVQWTDTCEVCSPDPFPKRNVKGIAFNETDVWPASLSLFRAGDATGADEALGFRVASMIPEPSTGTLALVCCGLMWWLRRRAK